MIVTNMFLQVAAKTALAASSALAPVAAEQPSMRNVNYILPKENILVTAKTARDTPYRLPLPQESQLDVGPSQAMRAVDDGISRRKMSKIKLGGNTQLVWGGKINDAVATMSVIAPGVK